MQAGLRGGNDSTEGWERKGRMGHRARGQEQQQRLPPCRGGEEEVYNSTPAIAAAREAASG